MDTIRTKILRDEEQRPVAVQIDYADWLKIERILSADAPDEKGTSTLDSHRGCLKLNEDPLAYQVRVRGEWE